MNKLGDMTCFFVCFFFASGLGSEKEWSSIQNGRSHRFNYRVETQPDGSYVVSNCMDNTGM